MSLFHSIVSWFVRQRIDEIEHFKKNPIEVQQAVFARLMHEGLNTKWGEMYDYAGIRNIKEFTERVPVSDYESLKPFIERVMKGEQKVLWPSDINWFAKSSGTTSDRSKFIPVSREALDECHFKGGRDTLALFCNNFPYLEIFDGKSLVMGGSHAVNKLNENSYMGDVSAVMMQNMPLIAHFLRTPELSIALLDEWEEKIERMARTTISQNVTTLAGVPTWTMVLIKKLFDMTGKDDLTEIWPNLRLYIHGGVSFTPYRSFFRSAIRHKDMQYMEVYNASEGFFALQDEPDSEDLLLMLDYGIFYEFMSLEDLANQSPKTLTLEEVEVGKTYAMLISTNAGLWRYLIGDTVTFTRTFPFKVKVAGRTKQYINVFGEEVMIDNTDKAMAKACQAAGVIINDYTVAPVFLSGKERGKHQWLVEFEKPPEDKPAFERLLDDNLRSINSDYDAKRYKNIALENLEIVVLPKGLFSAWLKSKGKLGGQHKVPRLSNDRKYVDELLKLLHDLQ